MVYGKELNFGLREPRLSSRSPEAHGFVTAHCCIVFNSCGVFVITRKYQTAQPKTTPNAKRGAEAPHLSRPRRNVSSGGVVHLELDWMRRMLEAVHFFPLQLDIALDHILAEDIALQQELVV